MREYYNKKMLTDDREYLKMSAVDVPSFIKRSRKR
jgi:hypothetical protein